MLNNGMHQIDEVFMKKRFFEVPSYQRAYAWEEKQQRDFFEDFKNNYNGTNYYYGTLLLQEIETGKKFEIVDGQQRITTFIIFMNCLIDRLKKVINEVDINEREIEDLEECFIKFNSNYKLKLQDQDSLFFQSCILKDEELDADTPSKRRLMMAKNNFKKWIQDEVSNDELVDIKDKICNANVLVYAISDRKEASMIFETTNDRGKSLTDLEKAKSFLMYKVSSILENPDDLLGEIESAFESIYRNFEAMGSKSIKEESVLQYSFIANERWESSEKYQKPYQHCLEILKIKIDDLIQIGNEEFVNKKDDDEREHDECYTQLIEYVRNYITDLMTTFSIISKLITKPTEEMQDILALGKIASFYPLLIKAYKLDKDKEKINFKQVCRMCEIFSFRVYVILDWRAYTYQTKLYQLARNFGEENDLKTFDDLFKKLTTYIIELGDDEKFIEEISRKDFYEKYESYERKYFFWKYENYLRGEKYNHMPHSDLTTTDTKKKLTIEHIVAQANEDEQQRVIKDANIRDVGDEENFQKEYLHSVGNLTIDPLSPNASKGKEDVKTKINDFFNSAPLMCQNELVSFLENIDGEKKWTLNSINKRKNKIIKFAEELWCDPLKEYNVTESKKNDLDDNIEENEINEINEEEIENEMYNSEE